MSDLFAEPDDATPLELEERNSLLQTWITFRSELNEAEQINIAAGAAWAYRQRRQDILTEAFIRQLHRKILSDVWAWAGDFRQTERNIGIDAIRIPVEVRSVLDDVRYWVKNETFLPDEISVRLHHRLVAIHPFPNGNGRVTRLLADLLVERLGQESFSWGRTTLTDVNETRSEYIAALKAADSHDIKPLLEFARS